jgi:hypothetical protein
MPFLLGAAQGVLNDIGLAILDFTDSLLFYVLLAVAVGIMCLISKSKRSRWPVRDEVIKCVLGVAALGTAIQILCVFLLTEPPAVATLSREDRWVVGIVTLILFLYEGFPAIKSSLFK